MDITCPRCGRIVSASEYFCNNCGHALFEPGSEDAGTVSSDRSGPRFENPAGGKPYSEPLDTIAPPSGKDGAGTPASAIYEPPSRRKRRFRIRWGWVMAAMIIAICALGIFFAYEIFHVPAIKTSVPPGWVEGPDLVADMTRNALEDNYSNAELDYLFCRPDDMGLDVDGQNIYFTGDIIYIAHIKYVLYDDMPETENIEEMESYLRVKRSLISDRLSQEVEVREIESMRLGCGNVGMYVLSSPSGSRLVVEELMVKKKNTLYLIVVAQPGPMRYPSEDMQYLSENIAFD